ncbi:hypothetical protein FACS1894158_03620 [Betaproteobacteria bacterium]|nr:hypothetical protein FACS1894158_03620 [Betaproteobacteria bacterium]
MLGFASLTANLCEIREQMSGVRYQNRMAPFRTRLLSIRALGGTLISLPELRQGNDHERAEQNHGP